MSNSKRQINTLVDLKGLRIRTPRNRLMRDTYLALGAVVDPISWAETFDALKNNMVDGQENPYNVIYTSQFWKAGQKYICNNGPFLWTGPILISNSFYKKQSPELQSALNRAGLEAAQLQWAWIKEKNSAYREALIKNGIKISELSDKDQWIQATRGVWDNYYMSIGSGNKDDGKRIVQKVLRIIKSD